MPKKISTLLHRPQFWGLLFLALLLALSAHLRRNDFAKPTGSLNLEATYHVLLTMAAFESSPATNHLFLPSVSLGGSQDKLIPWGMAYPTRTGDMIYSSFPALGFIAPYLYFKTFGIPATQKNLAYFNFALGCATAFLLYWLLVGILRYCGYPTGISTGGALAGTLIAIWSREALLSHGIIYWCQELYQPILAASLFFLFKYWTGEEPSRRFYARALMAAALAGALTEWTGYLFNAALALLLYFGKIHPSQSKPLAAKIVLMTVLAAGLTILHYGIGIGFKPTMQIFLDRFLARGTSHGSYVALFQGYAISYGLFLVIIVIGLIWRSFDGLRPRIVDNRQRAMWLIFLAFCAPLVENLVLLQHATQFSYDRLKLVFPAALFIALLFASVRASGRIVLVCCLLLAGWHGYTSYRHNLELEPFGTWNDVDTANKNLVARVLDKVDGECTVFTFSWVVRGYLPLILGRNAYEHKTLAESIALAQEKNACTTVYFQGVPANYDLPRLNVATIVYRNGETTILASENR